MPAKDETFTFSRFRPIPQKGSDPLNQTELLFPLIFISLEDDSSIVIPPQPTDPGEIMSGGEGEPVEADVPAEDETVSPQGTHVTGTQTVTHEYLTLNGKVARETIKTNNSLTAVLDFIYDESGKPFALKYSTNGTSFQTYYYVLNLQGDVVKLIHYIPGFEYESVATYEYDAWGNIVSSSGRLAEINPLRYRGYYYDSETGFYYLQSRYYDPANRRFINADVYASTDSSDAVSCNMFAYCNNNPVINTDPSGELLITTLILGGAALIGAGVAFYTGYKARKAGCDWADTVFYAAGSGLCAFTSVYTFGMSAYGVYANYCILNGMSPVTQVGNTPSTSEQLQTCADTANSSVSGNGHVAGSQKHTVFANEVDALGNPNLRTEVSYLNGSEVQYGTRGSIRFDVLEYNSSGIPIHAYDFKTGSAILTPARVLRMQTASGLAIPIDMIK